MRGLIPGMALVISTRVLSFGAALCFAVAVGSLGAVPASAQAFCTWNDQFMRWDCPGGTVTSRPYIGLPLRIQAAR